MPRFSRSTPLALSFLLGLTSPSIAATEFHNALSLQGFTGILNTPNAETTDQGRIYLLYNNQIESDWRQKASKEDNYIFSVGFFNLVEVGGRLVEAPHKARDLSANFKVKLPLPKGDYIPKIAFGMQDIGGGQTSTMLKTRFGVISEEIWRLRFSAGYGTGPDRMKGIFGGVEVKTCDYLYLLAEDDTREKNVGLRFVTPQLFGYPVNLQATVKSSLDHRPAHPDFAVGFQIPLGTEHNRTAPIAQSSSAPLAQSASTVLNQTSTAPTVQSSSAPRPLEGGVRQTQPLPLQAGGQQTQPLPLQEGGQQNRSLPLQGGGQVGDGVPPHEVSTGERALTRLHKRLTDDGFQNVKIGYKDELLVVEYENARYNHNELDAIGVVAGMAQQEAPSQFRALRIVERKKGIAVQQWDMPMQELRAFFTDAAALPAFCSALAITRNAGDESGVTFIKANPHSSYLHASLVLYPNLKTYVGTEISPFDYLLSIKPDLYVNTWKGSVINARWDIPVAWSKNFDDGKPFSGDRQHPELERLMLFQALKPTSTVMATLGAGMVVHDSYGTLNEVAWTPGDGTHEIKLTQAFAHDSESGTKREAYLESYRYFFSPLNLYLQETGGKFWTQDRGAMLEIERFFGDTLLSIYYKNAVASDGRNHQAAGIRIELPLTPRRDMKPYPLQLRGSEDWSYAQETSVARSGSANYLGTPIGQTPEPPFNIDRVFYNRDRMSEAYFKDHLLRLRDAYARYVLP